jgi:hypothetical protein
MALKPNKKGATMPNFNLQKAFETVHSKLDIISKEQTDAAIHLGQVDVHLAGLLGNGQPGRIKIIEDRVGGLVQQKDWLKGYVAAIGAIVVILGALAHFLVDVLLKK